MSASQTWFDPVDDDDSFSHVPARSLSKESRDKAKELVEEIVQSSKPELPAAKKKAFYDYNRASNISSDELLELANSIRLKRLERGFDDDNLTSPFIHGFVRAQGTFTLVVLLHENDEVRVGVSKRNRGLDVSGYLLEKIPELGFFDEIVEVLQELDCPADEWSNEVGAKLAIHRALESPPVSLWHIDTEKEDA